MEPFSIPADDSTPFSRMAIPKAPATERLEATNKLLREVLKAGSVVNPQHATALREAVAANQAVITPKRPKKRRMRATAR